MIRNFNIFLIFTSVFVLSSVYGLKFSIENTASERTELIAQIDSQEGELSILKADEAVLSQPGHIGPIVARHELEQFGAFADLPMRPVQQQPNSSAMNSLFQALEAGVDPIDAILELEGIE
jgi:hypothetical protein